jgi:hypothetical protein
VARWPVFSGVDRADWQQRAERSEWSAAHEWTVEAGAGYRVRVAGRVFIPSADLALCLQPSQGRLALGLPGSCYAVPAPTGYTGLWLGLAVPDLMGRAVPGPLGLRRSPGTAQIGLGAGTTHLKSCRDVLVPCQQGRASCRPI